MKKIKLIIGFFLFMSLLSVKYITSSTQEKHYSVDELRKLYSSTDISKYPKAEIDSTVINFQELGVLPPVAFPDDNPFSEAKRELGKILFFDPRLSSSGQISCASCHDPDLGWGDGKRVSHGHNREPGKRNAKTIINSAYATSLFWDGRASSLEDQAKFPIKDEKEMNHDLKKAEKRIRKIKGYKPLFKAAYGDEKVTLTRITKAIATFERTVVSRKSHFDKFIEGDSTQLSDKEVLGLHLFRTKARCINCHNSPYFSDNQFHNLGLTYYKRKFEDLGLYNITHNSEDVGKFRTPSLREVGKTEPYMHNGLFPHLHGVLNMYNAGMPKNLPKTNEQKSDKLYPVTSPLLKKLNLSKDELVALESFLESITSVIYREPAPEKLPE